MLAPPSRLPCRRARFVGGGGEGVCGHRLHHPRHAARAVGHCGQGARGPRPGRCGRRAVRAGDCVLCGWVVVAVYGGALRRQLLAGELSSALLLRSTPAEAQHAQEPRLLLLSSFCHLTSACPSPHANLCAGPTATCALPWPCSAWWRPATRRPSAGTTWRACCASASARAAPTRSSRATPASPCSAWLTASRAGGLVVVIVGCHKSYCPCAAPFCASAGKICVVGTGSVSKQPACSRAQCARRRAKSGQLCPPPPPWLPILTAPAPCSQPL